VARRHWQITVDLAPGDHDFVVRAWDSSAAAQPENEAAVWNPKGFVNNTCPRVRVRAADTVASAHREARLTSWASRVHPFTR
jgi:NADH:ubiquinone oxidoreductase subunit